MANQLSPSARQEMSDDDISLESSDSEQEEEYIVEEILAERVSDDVHPRYLVKWENYGEERCGLTFRPQYRDVCTWEPAESFLDPRSLQDWTKKRDAGVPLASHLVDEIDAKINVYEEEKALRKVRRQVKRRKLAARSSTISIKGGTPRSAVIPRKDQDIVEPIRSSTATRRNRPNAENTRPSPILGKSFSASNMFHPQSGRLTEIPVIKDSVFHGIGGATLGGGGHHAHRTGNKRTFKTANFRNLRHMNNARKVASQEPSPDINKIKLRSLAEWAESAPEDTNLQLPPAPALSTSRLDTRDPATADTRSVTTQVASSAKLAEGFSRGVVRHNVPSNVVSDVAWPGSSSNDATITQKRADPYDGQERRLRTFFNGRFFYYPGEFLANLKFGRAHIGDVRIRGLPSWAIGHILRLRSASQLRLEIGSNDVVTPTQWAQLCTGRSNTLQPTGVIIPFEDTENTVSEMERYLHQHQLAALWYHPTEDLMLVLYSPRSTAWFFLENMGGLPFDSNIRVLTRNKMPPTETLSVDRIASEDSNQILPSSPTLPGADGRSSASTAKASDLSALSASRSRRPSLVGSLDSALPSFFSSKQHSSDPAILGRPDVQSSSDDIYTLQDDGQDPAFSHFLKTDSTVAPSHVSEAEADSFELSLQPGQNIRDAFWDAFQISYDQLTAVPPSKNVDRNSAEARFYIVYPATAQRELACLQKFLRSYTFHTNICTSMEERGWEAFQNIYKGDYIGAILFHDACTNYHTLPRLAHYLRSSSLTVFRLSLSKPLKYCADHCHIERLFPSGMAILLTEAAMMNGSAAILRWFGKKRKGASWKLLLRPNIRSWLRHMALSSAPEQTERFIDALQELEKLSPGFSALRNRSDLNEELSSDTESIDGLSDGSGGPGPVFAPSSILAYDRPPPPGKKGSIEHWKDRVLIEYFAGWGIAHAEIHRKLIAITPFPDEAYAKWGHIEVLKPEKFMQREGIEDGQRFGTPRS